MGHSWVSTIGWVAILATCLFAWAKGGLAERQGAILLLVSEIVGEIVLALTFPHWSNVGLFAADLGLAIGLLILALIHSSIWLGLTMLLQSVVLCSQGLVLGGDGPSPFTFMILNNVVSIAILACIITATALSWRARVKAKGDTGRLAVPEAHHLVSVI